MGTMHSGWNDVTATFFMKKEADFKPNLQENEWGESVGALSLALLLFNFYLKFSKYSENHSGPLFALAGSSFTFYGEKNNEKDVAHVLQLTVESQVKQAFQGYAFGMWGVERLFKMRATQRENGAVAILLEEEELTGDATNVTLMLLGHISSSLVMRGVFVEDLGGEELQSGTFCLNPTKWVNKDKKKEGAAE
jgi:hypothetical protein